MDEVLALVAQLNDAERSLLAAALAHPDAALQPSHAVRLGACAILLVLQLVEWTPTDPPLVVPTALGRAVGAILLESDASISQEGKYAPFTG